MESIENQSRTRQVLLGLSSRKCMPHTQSFPCAANYEESIKIYSRALGSSPELPNLHYNLANSFLDAGIQKDFSLLSHSVAAYTVCLGLEVRLILWLYE